MRSINSSFICHIFQRMDCDAKLQQPGSSGSEASPSSGSSLSLMQPMTTLSSSALVFTPPHAVLLPTRLGHEGWFALARREHPYTMANASNINTYSPRGCSSDRSGAQLEHRDDVWGSIKTHKKMTYFTAGHVSTLKLTPGTLTSSSFIA